MYEHAILNQFRTLSFLSIFLHIVFMVDWAEELEACFQDVAFLPSQLVLTQYLLLIVVAFKTSVLPHLL